MKSPDYVQVLEDSEDSNLSRVLDFRKSDISELIAYFH
jgi:hypothetical protein